MPGHRRRRNPGAPLQRKTKADRRQARYVERLAAATTDIERMRVTFDYLWSTASSIEKSKPDLARPYIKHTTEHLAQLARDLTAAHMRSK